MPENFDRLDSGDVAAGGQEQAGENDERFQERYRRAQAAVKKIRQQEGKKKQQDNTVARIIVQFLSDPRFTRFFLLISRIVARNIPSDLILAILSLIHKESSEVIAQRELVSTEQNLSRETEAQQFPPQLKASIDRWIETIAAVATAEPHAALETLVDENWQLDQNVPELATAVLQQFFVFKNIDVPPLENLQGFTSGFFQMLLGRLEQQVHDQTALSGETDEDFGE